MKTLVKTTTHIDPKAIDEVKELFPVISFTIERVQERPVPTWNPYFKLIEVDWSWFRRLFVETGYDIHTYVATRDQLRAANITKYLGLYSLDNDGIHEFWFGLPTSLHKDAKANGFKTNFAYLFTHELCHGLEHFGKQKDRTHEMVAQGRLKELASYYSSAPVTPVDKSQVVLLAKQAIALFLRLLRGRYARPLPNHWHLVTQRYLNPDPITYPATGVHVGTDFATPLGTPILAPDDGRITRSGYSPSLGYWVEFQFGNLYLVSLHCANSQAPRPVLRNEPFAFVGDTGLINGIHSHLEGWFRPMDRSLLTNKEMVEAVTFDVTKLIP